MSGHMRMIKYGFGLLIVLASIYVYYLGYTIHTIDPKVDRTAFIAAIWKHVGYAMLLFVPAGVYIFLTKRSHVKASFKPWETWTIRLFKASFALKMITGPLAVWTRGSTLKVFDWFGIPSPVERMDGPHEFMEQFHALLNYPLVIFFILSGYILALRLFKNRLPL